MNTLLNEFIEFVETKNDIEGINHTSFETCAIGEFYKHTGDPLRTARGVYNSPYSKAKNILRELSNIPSNIKLGEDIFYDVCGCQTYGELKQLMSKVKQGVI